MENLSGEPRTLFVELIGPAGAGKTTLSRALTQANEKVAIGAPLQLRKLRQLPFFLRRALPMAPMFATSKRNGRRFTWEEVKAFVYVNGWHQVLKRGAARNLTAILLDHGPVFQLASLKEFGPEILKERVFDTWWDKILKQWALTLDILIWLDAPDRILLDRINSRAQRHVVKARQEKEAYEFLARYRRAYEEIIAKLTAKGDPRLLLFDTSQKSLEDIVEALLAVFDPESLASPQVNRS